jgi:hypothetical protein
MMSDVDLRLFWESARYRTARPKPLIRVYQGGKHALQFESFNIYLENLQKDFGFEMEVKTVEDIRDERCSEATFVEWLLGADVHFILSHPHQGAGINALLWNMNTLRENIQRLKYHLLLNLDALSSFKINTNI